MSESLAVNTADALVALLNGGSFSQEFTAFRTYAPKLDQKDLQALQVYVVCTLREQVIAGRGGGQDMNTVRPAVMIQQAVDPYNNSQVDPLTLVTEELEEFVERKGLKIATNSGNQKMSYVGQSPAELEPTAFWQLRLFMAGFVVEYKLGGI